MARMLLSVRTSSSFMLYFHRKIQYTFLLKFSTQVCLSTQCVSSVVLFVCVSPLQWTAFADQGVSCHDRLDQNTLRYSVAN